MNKTDCSLLLLVFLMYSFSFSQTGWYKQSPLPTPEYLKDVHFVDQFDGWLTGQNGTIVHTTDEGQTWTDHSFATTDGINAVQFTNSDLGCVVGDNGLIAITSDGGGFWNDRSVFGNSTTLNDVYFATEQLGWAAGENGFLIVTTDGGNTWVQQTSDIFENINSVHFSGPDSGWAVGNSGRIIYTIDSGNSWTLAVSDTTLNLHSVYFVNNSEGWAVGDAGLILHSVDGGMTWETQINPQGTTLESVAFVDNETGWAAGGAGGFSALVYTDDGGTTWQTQQTGIEFPYGHSAVFPIDQNTCWIAAAGGSIARTTDAGMTWQQINNGTALSLLDVNFLDDNIGWAMTGGGAIVRTSDAGNHWTNISIHGLMSMDAISFVSKDEGWRVGAVGSVAHTLDGGSSWTAQTSNVSQWLHAVFFMDSLNGWAVGDSSYIIHTSNGGAEWSRQITPGGDNLYSVFFSDLNHGWAAGDAGVILFTDDGGQSWTDQTTPIAERLNEIHLVNPANGWAVGMNGTIISYDGLNWSSQVSGTLENLTSIRMVSEFRGFAAGDSGTVLITNDGGNSWSTQTSNTTENLSSIFFSDANNGWVAGQTGTIMHTADGGGDPVPILESSAGTLDFPQILSGETHALPFQLRNSGALDLNITAKNLEGLNASEFSFVMGDGPVNISAGDSQQVVLRFHPDSSGAKSAFLIVESDAQSSPDTFIVSAAAADSGWFEQNSGTTTWLRSICFIDDKQGWAAGVGGELIHTLDGGYNWIPQSSGTSSSINTVFFVDEKNGWICGLGGEIYRTEDGGDSWNYQTSNTANQLTSIFFTDDQDGWAVGASGTIVHTSNGGDIWEVQTSGTPFWLSAVHFSDNQNGWIAGDGGLILHTSDGGQNWNPQSSPISSYLLSVYFADNQHGWAVGYFGTIIATSDGGQTWNEQNSGTGYRLFDVCFSNAQTGWAVGYDGTIVHTSNAGQNWTDQSYPTFHDLSSAWFIDNQTGWITGVNGIILHTVDGGGVPQLAKLDFSAGNLSFPQTQLNDYRDGYITMYNSGGLDLNISSRSIEGPDADNFILLSPGGASTIVPGDSELVIVRFSPDSFGIKSSQFIIHSDAPTSPDTILLNGICSTAGFSLSVNGTNYVNCGNDTTLDVHYSFSVEAWIRGDEIQPPTANGYGRIVDKHNWANRQGYTINRRPANNSVMLDFYDTGGIQNVTSGHTPITDENWHHVAATYDGNASRIYIDGLLEGEQVIGPKQINPSSNNLCIGANFDGANWQHFGGEIDEVRIWRVARSHKQIVSTMMDTLTSEYYTSADSGLIGYWRFNSYEDLGINDDGSDDIRDLTYNQNHGDASNNPLLVPSGAFSGITQQPVVNLDIPLVNFPVTRLGGNSDVNLHIHNTGNSDLSISTKIIEGPDADQYLISQGAEPSTIAAGDSETVTLRFVPLSVGLKSAIFIIESNAASSPDTIDLNGSAIAGNTALYFNGINNYVESLNNLEISGSSERTVSIWLKSVQLYSSSCCATPFSWGSPSGGAGFGNFISNGEWWFWGYQNDINTFNRVNLEWNNHTITYDGTEVVYYLNGDVIERGPRTLNTSLSHFLVGDGFDHRADTKYNGLADEVRIWNRVLIPEEINQILYRNLTAAEISDSNLVLYWKFDEGSGFASGDVSLSDNPGTLINMDSLTSWQPAVLPFSSELTGSLSDLAGIWAGVDSNASSILSLRDTSLNADEMIHFGHNNARLDFNTGDVPTNLDINQRLDRIWRIETSASLSGDLIFDLKNHEYLPGSSFAVLTDADSNFIDSDTLHGNFNDQDSSFTVSGHTYSHGYYYTLGLTEVDQRSLQLSERVLNFQQTSIGGQTSLWVILYNSGFQNLNISSKSISGGNVSEFSIIQGMGGSTVTPGDSELVRLQFAPQSVGIKLTNLIIVSDAPSSPDTVFLTGNNFPIVHLGQAPVFEDNIGLTITPPQHFSPDSSLLYYRKGGESNWHDKDLVSVGNDYVVDIDSSFSTIRGIEYYIYFSDSLHRVITYPPENPKSNPAVIQVQIDQMAAAPALSPEKYRMISLPLELVDGAPHSVFADDYGEYNKKYWRLLRWNPDEGIHEEYPVMQSPFIPGYACWLIIREGLPFDLDDGLSVRSGSPISITIRHGWNQIGNPFAFPVTWDNVENSSLLNSPVYWNGDEYDYTHRDLQPWEGYYIFNDSSEAINISFPATESGSHLPKQTSTKVVSLPEFMVQLLAEGMQNGESDLYNYVGMKAGAKDEFDRLDYLQAPAIVTKLELSIIENERKYAGNFKPISDEGAPWDLQLSDIKQNKDVQLTFSNINELPEGFNIWLLNLDKYNSIKIEDNQALINTHNVDDKINLSLIIGTESYAEQVSGGIPLQPLKFALFQNYPNPFNPHTVIQYQLAERVDVRLEIYNILGQKVRTFERKSQDTGLHQVTWDGTNDQGIRTGSGILIYKIKAGSFSEARKMILIR